MVFDSILLVQLSITSSCLEEIMLLRISSDSFKTKSVIGPFAIVFSAVMAAPPTDNRLFYPLIESYCENLHNPTSVLVQRFVYFL